MKISVLTAFLVIALPVPAFAADWVFVIESDEGNKTYIDRQSIRTMPNGYKRAWFQNDLAKVDKDGDNRYRGYREFDCIEKRDRFLSQIYLKDDFVTGTHAKVTDWTYVAPDSVSEFLLQFVCRR